MTRAYFVSDIHLKSSDEPKAAIFSRFLDGLMSERPTHLFLVGDIFDLWVGDHEFFREKFHAIVEKIEALAKAGVEVHYFEGNHDLHLTKFWSDKLGVRVHADAATFELGGKRVRVEHGDLINPDDRGYLFLRWLLRTSVVTSLAMNLPQNVVNAIGRRASRTSRKYTSTAKALPTNSIRAAIRAHAERESHRDPFDLLVSGHVHVVDDVTFEVGTRQVRSVNLGSWYDFAKTFVVTETKAEFIGLE